MYTDSILAGFEFPDSCVNGAFVGIDVQKSIPSPESG
jgi:hypothetical protein